DKLARPRHADPRQHVDRLLTGRLAVEPEVQPDALEQHVPDRVHGAERRHRLLRDVGDLLAADPADLGAVRVEPGPTDGLAGPPGEQDLAADAAAGRGRDAARGPSGTPPRAAAI